MVSSPDPDLRALALAILHASGPASGELGVESLQPGSHPAEALDLDAAIAREPLPVRRRWVMILGFFSDEAAGRGDLGTAEELLVRALVSHDRRCRGPQIAGTCGEPGGGPRGAAIQHFTESLETDPDQPLVHVNRGIAYAAAGDPGRGHSRLPVRRHSEPVRAARALQPRQRASARRQRCGGDPSLRTRGRRRSRTRPGPCQSGHRAGPGRACAGSAGPCAHRRFVRSQGTKPPTRCCRSWRRPSPAVLDRQPVSFYPARYRIEPYLSLHKELSSSCPTSATPHSSPLPSPDWP